MFKGERDLKYVVQSICENADLMNVLLNVIAYLVVTKEEKWTVVYREDDGTMGGAWSIAPVNYWVRYSRKETYMCRGGHYTTDMVTYRYLIVDGHIFDNNGKAEQYLMNQGFSHDQAIEYIASMDTLDLVDRAY